MLRTSWFSAAVLLFSSAFATSAMAQSASQVSEPAPGAAAPARPVRTAIDTSHLASIPESSNDPLDLRTEDQVRRALLADPGLSNEARHVRVLSYEGEVTLRGQVRSPEERFRVAADAAEVLGGAYRVHDRLTTAR